MKTAFIKGGGRGLVVFFNGWGMDQNPVRHLAPGDFDLLLLHDFTDLSLDLDFEELLSRYDERHLVAWSLGVHSAAAFLGGRDFGWGSALAVNGTLEPVSASCGIAPEVFAGTIEGWSEQAARKFNKRMCVASEVFGFFSQNAPKRGVLDQKAELRAISDRVLALKSVNNPFKAAVIGSQDRIFLPQNQQNAWQSANIPFKTLELPHYPFAGFSGIVEALALG